MLDKFIEGHKNPITFIFHIIGIIIAIYGIWQHDLKIIAIAVLIMLIGHLLPKKKEEPVKKRGKK